MVRRVCIALLVTTVASQTAMAQAQGTTGRGSFVGWMKSKVTGTPTASARPTQSVRPPQYYRSQTPYPTAPMNTLGQRAASATDVQRAVAAATGNAPKQQYFPSQYRTAATQTASRQVTAGQQQAAAAQQRARYEAAQRTQAAAAQQQRAQYEAARRAQAYAAQQQRGPSPQQMQQQQYAAQMQRARQQQASQSQPYRFASQSRQVSAPTRTAAMTRLSPTPSSTRPQVPARQVPVRQVSMTQMSHGGGQAYSGYPVASSGRYPATSAGLYSSPLPNIPYQVGMTAITNQALYPHEFLYAHEYKAIYPPYYYKVKGHWLTTPFGVWSQEKWKPMGTEVNVKYRSRISPFSGFVRPMN